MTDTSRTTFVLYVIYVAGIRVMHMSYICYTNQTPPMYYRCGTTGHVCMWMCACRQVLCLKIPSNTYFMNSVRRSLALGMNRFWNCSKLSVFIIFLSKHITTKHALMVFRNIVKNIFKNKPDHDTLITKYVVWSTSLYIHLYSKCITALLLYVNTN